MFRTIKELRFLAVERIYEIQNYKEAFDFTAYTLLAPCSLLITTKKSSHQLLMPAIFNRNLPFCFESLFISDHIVENYRILINFTA